jgi:hypothetical protein
MNIQRLLAGTRRVYHFLEKGARTYILLARP